MSGNKVNTISATFSVNIALSKLGLAQELRCRKKKKISPKIPIIMHENLMEK
jgi:hypothetical protein